jgi:hypothetical protein
MGISFIFAFCLMPRHVTCFHIPSVTRQHTSTSYKRQFPGRLFAQSEKDKKTLASMRFTGGESGDGSLVSSDNPLDQILAWLSSDIVSIVLGTIGLFLVVVHRLALLDDATTSSAEALTSETRADLLAVFACGSVLLNGVTKLDVTTALAESVVLEGITLEEVEIQNQKTAEGKEGLSWAMDSLLNATPAKTAVLISKSNDGGGEWVVQSRAGVVPTSGATSSIVPEKSPILDRVGSPGNVKETYLPTLQALPGRFEFAYLPSNTQLALLVPVAASSRDGEVCSSVLVLGSNTAKSFTPRDIAWTRVVSERMREYL